MKRVGVEIVEADLLKPDTLEQAMEDVEGVFQVAAVYATRARDPQKEIILNLSDAGTEGSSFTLSIGKASLYWC